MARGEDTRNHPNRRISLDNFAQIAQLGRELSKGFPQIDDNAPAGGIPRPKMHSCGGCGESTPTSSGLCADCNK